MALISKEFGYLVYSENDHKYLYKNDFVKKFNAALQTMNKNGEIEKIIEKHLE